MTELKACPADAYKEVRGMTEFKACPADAYKEVRGMTEFKACPADAYKEVRGIIVAFIALRNASRTGEFVSHWRPCFSTDRNFF
ncbi:hypothetical protein DPMN_157426 [Dreissena polymorpha]|uniref:Uncharacterized protein n=1 Tax=Dreissena polymorpha TaxID=45954 RepID=A0A9D4EFX8_DREPO|nr:hypothetical protein DPMN_157426 [Dreissena polymorpha]